jgi:hypothetical protein
VDVHQPGEKRKVICNSVVIHTPISAWGGEFLTLKLSHATV